MCVVHRQLRMAAGSQSTTGPWVIVYFGLNLKGFAEAFGEIGMLYVPYKRPPRPDEAPDMGHASQANDQADSNHTDDKEEFKVTHTFQLADYVLTVNAHA